MVERGWVGIGEVMSLVDQVGVVVGGMWRCPSG